jgi:hypothetical protein
MSGFALAEHGAIDGHAMRARSSTFRLLSPRFGVAAFVRHWINASMCIFPVVKFTVPSPQICLALTQSYFGSSHLVSIS